MKKATSKDIEILMSTTSDCCISLYVPTHAGATNQQRDAIIFKNVLKKLNNNLDSQKLKSSEKSNIVNAVDKALSQELLSRRDGSLALFHDSRSLRGYFIKDVVKPAVKLGTKFYLAPLQLSRLTAVSFVIVSLSQETVDVFQCTSTTIKKLRLGANQADPLYKELNLDEIIKNLQTHPSQKGGSGGSFGFHGQGAFKAQHKKLIKRYFRKIDKNIANIVNLANLKVILAGVDYLIPIYKEVSKIKNIQDVTIHGNFQKMSNKELLAQANKLLKS